VILNKEFISRILNDNILTYDIADVKIKFSRGFLTVVGVHSPEEGKKEGCQEFYKNVQTHTD
jgi:hypothetical protein